MTQEGSADKDIADLSDPTISENEVETEIENITLKEIQETINTTHPFGIRLWKPALYKKTRGIERITDEAIHALPEQQPSSNNYHRVKSLDCHFSFGNILWLVLFGWWMGVVYFIGSLILTLSWVGRDYGRMLRNVGWYIVWPFGRFVQVKASCCLTLPEDLTCVNNLSTESIVVSPMISGCDSPSSQFYNNINNNQKDCNSSSDNLLLSNSNTGNISRRQAISAKLLYWFVFTVLLAPIHIIASVFCWLMVVSVPMAKLNRVIAIELFKRPLAIECKNGQETISGELLLCTYKAIGWRYYKYTYDGINIIIINLAAVVIFVVIDGFVIAPAIGHNGIGHPIVIFIMSILSVIPLAYYIGMAVSSISAQSSYGLGAVINATFGSIVEIILYCFAIKDGKVELTEGAVIGSLIGTLLLLPGLSMIAGGIKVKQQQFNAKSMSVSSTMLIMCVIGLVLPTIFYHFFGSYNVICSGGCANGQCLSCKYSLNYQDPFYNEKIKPLVFFVCGMLPSAYFIGLLFSLRTHAKQIYEKLHVAKNVIGNNDIEIGIPLTSPSSHSRNQSVSATTSTSANHQKISSISIRRHSQQPSTISHSHNHEQSSTSSSGHNAPNWSKVKSSIILLSSTVLFAIIAELLVASVDDVLKDTGISEKFLGLTIFALVPSFTEFLNAIAFSIYGNISLSLEIGSAYALQIGLIQVPSLVFFSAAYNHGFENYFSMIFSRYDSLCVFLAVFLLNYVYGEGNSNYFKGAILTLSYLVLLIPSALI